MKILKKGTIPAEKKAKKECPHCGTIVELTMGEATVTRDQRSGDFASFDCPICSYRCHIDINSFK